MTKTAFLRTSVLLLGCFAFWCGPALAQHGGGGHGGGGGARAGGGGFRGGSFGGGRAASAPRSFGGGSRSASGFYRQPPATAGANRYGNPGGASRRGNSSANAGAYRPAPGTVNPYRNDGQWHYFGGPTSASRPADSGEVRSFAGEGSDVRETTASAAPASSPRLGSAGPSIGPVRLVGSSPVLAATAPARTNFGVANFNSGFGIRGSAYGPGFGAGGFGSNRFGVGFNRLGRFGRFGFGYRFGYPFFGLGFGWPFWGGVGYWDSCAGGPGWFGTGYGFGYGYDPFWYDSAPCTGLWGSGYGPWDINADPYPEPYYSPDDQQYPDYQQYPNDQQYEQQGPPPEEQAPPPGDQDNPQGDVYSPAPYSSSNDSGNDSGEPSEQAQRAMMPVQLYLKSGGVFNITVYWISGDKFNYVTDNGAVIAIGLDQVDLPRTISENAKRGVPFTLTVQAGNKL